MSADPTTRTDINTSTKDAMPNISRKFWHFNQNNSGGNFVFDKEKGITHHVVIEACDADHANTRAEEIGLYFDGCDSGQDCDCCGDRWSRIYGDGDDAPLVYGKPAVDYQDMIRLMDGKPEVAIHYLDRPFEFGEAK